MTTIFFNVLLFQIKDWDKICKEEGMSFPDLSRHFFCL